MGLPPPSPLLGAVRPIPSGLALSLIASGFWFERDAAACASMTALLLFLKGSFGCLPD